MVIGLAVALMTAVTAHLLLLKPVLVQEELDLDVTIVFNGSLLTAESELRTALDLALTTQIHGTNPLAWRRGQDAFPALSSLSSSGFLNMTVKIEAISVAKPVL
jgi:hypothetical protein